MKIFFRFSCIAVAALMTVVACADKDSETDTEKEIRSFEAWMRVNILQNVNYTGVPEKLADGLYIEYLDKAANRGNTPITGDWVELNYKGMTLRGYNASLEEGYVFMNRDEDTARELGTYSSGTHYVPQYLQNNLQNGIMEAQHVALNQHMAKGDKVRLFMTYAWGATYTGLQTNYGYQGTADYPTGYPMIVEMELVDIIDEPMAFELNIVKRKAIDEWGMGEFDTIRDGLYLQVIEPGIEEDIVTSDSTIFINYAGYFARDGFLFDTNIGEVGLAWDRDTTATAKHTSLEYPANSLIEAFSESFASEKLRYGMKFRMVFTSTWGYGESVKTGGSGSPYIDPYTPMMFEVEIEEYVPDDNDE